jgi:nitrite reductase/ring-hydroxylating ferredoxin subunit
MDHEVVIFRTESGTPCIMDAYCPHLGAHLGHGGTVDGEVIRCPFHFFDFDTKGACVATGYGTKPPPIARARTWPVAEHNGFIFAHHDAGANQPSWQIPDLDMSGWTPPITQTYRLRGHPQETTENSVDIGHLGIVHGYDEVKMLSPLVLKGPYLNARYAMARPSGRFLGRIHAEFEVHVHGLGYSFVEVSIKNLGLHTRQFVFATPLDDEHINLRIAMSVKKISRSSPLPWWLGLVPGPLLNAVLPPMLMKGFAHDVSQDFVIWENKIFVQPPALAEGDGPLGRYRQWTRQFYQNASSTGEQ